MTAWLLIAIGCLARLLPYVSNRSLWGDEASIALNLRLRTFWELAYPLDFDQTMPIPLLMGIKLVGTLVGYHETALRLIPFVAGCVLLGVVWCCFSRYTTKSLALIIVAIAVSFRPLIYYSSELKQYETDALVTAVTIWCGLWMLQPDHLNRFRALAWFGCWGIAAILLSQPSVFVLASFATAAFVDPNFRRSKALWVYWCGLASLWTIAFGCLYWFSYRQTSQSAFMRAFWGKDFLNFSAPGLLNRCAASMWTLLGSNHIPGWRSFFLAALFAVGLIEILRSRGLRVLVAAAGAYVLFIVASGLCLYPVADRLILFTAPLLFWIYAAGLVGCSRLFGRALAPVAQACGAVALVSSAITCAVPLVVNPPLREATRQVSHCIAARSDGAPVYLALGAYRQWTYYTSDWMRPEAVRAQIDAIERRIHQETVSFVPASVHQSRILTSVPPTEPTGDRRWAAVEARKLTELLSNRPFWLFLPIYRDAYKSRGVLGLLQKEISAHGWTRSAECSAGETIALRYDSVRTSAVNAPKSMSSAPN